MAIIEAMSDRFEGITNVFPAFASRPNSSMYCSAILSCMALSPPAVCSASATLRMPSAVAVATVRMASASPSASLIFCCLAFDYAVRDLIDDGMRSLGLDPAQITDVLVTHGHGDHFGGVKYLQERYGPRVFLGPGDWDIVDKAGYVGIGQPLPQRDRVATDGQTVSAGDTAVTVYHTPGHTPGTLSFIIPVRIDGTPHVAAFWGGTAMFGSLEDYAASARRFGELASRAGADIVLSNHDWAVDFSKKLAVLKADPTGPNPFVVGTDGVLRFTQVAEHCARAVIAARRQ